MTGHTPDETGRRDCPFCHRVKYRTCHATSDIDVVTFEPLNPVTPGHRLFLPRHHFCAADFDPYMAGRVFAAAAQYASVQLDAFNLITSSGSLATQTIEHMHVHYVPRRIGDGLHLPWTGQREAS